ncbi:MAG: hypothetical protein G8345_21045, partial [Magnetococcales bacterium]|nr:hypothetical protein [Magnetococcales bacterium]
MELLKESTTNQRGGPRVLVVCAPPHFPCSRALLRLGWRLANTMNTPWFLLHVTQSLGEVRATPREHFALAEELGAEVVHLTAMDTIHASLDFARSHAVGHLVINRTEPKP